MKLKEYLDYLVKFIKDSVNEASAKGVIVGISGGIDSAVVAYLAKKAFPDNYLTVWLPLESSKEDWDCAKELVEKESLNNVTVDLKTTYDELIKNIEKTNQEISPLAKANTKARLRMSTIYSLAQSNNYLVLGTDNLDEWYIGYFTKYGDGGVDLVPLIHLLKGEVREAAKLLGVPETIISRKPTAGLWEDQTDETEIGFSYDQIDDYLLNKTSDNQKLIDRIEHLHKISEHKRKGAKQPQDFKRK